MNMYVAWVWAHWITVTDFDKAQARNDYIQRDKLAKSFSLSKNKTLGHFLCM